MYKENFSERIKKARIEAGYTQPQVSEELKIPKSTISKYETGQLEPDLEKLATLADFYNVSIDWLLGIGQKIADYQQKPKISDQLFGAAALYTFLAILPLNEKKLFMSGKMPISNFLESNQFRNLTPEQKIYLYQEYQKQCWEEDQPNKAQEAI